MNLSVATELRRPAAPTVDKHAEQQLVRRACQGDSDAFGQLYEATFSRIYRYIYFRVTDEHTAEDMASRVYLKAWENLSRYHSSNVPFIAWLYTIAHNTVIDHYRTRREHVNLEEANTLPDHSPLPAEQCEQRFENESLRAALQQLTTEQREVVTLKMLDGLSTDEIAARMSKTAGAVRALQMRGLQALARLCHEQAY